LRHYNDRLAFPTTRATTLRLHTSLTRQLEEFVDQGLADGPVDAPTIDFERIPSGDELAAELQEFLRQRPDED